jgi:hypothetical protein
MGEGVLFSSFVAPSCNTYGSEPEAILKRKQEEETNLWNINVDKKNNNHAHKPVPAKSNSVFAKTDTIKLPDLSGIDLSEKEFTAADFEQPNLSEFYPADKPVSETAPQVDLKGAIKEMVFGPQAKKEVPAEECKIEAGEYVIPEDQADAITVGKTNFSEVGMPKLIKESNDNSVYKPRMSRKGHPGIISERQGIVLHEQQADTAQIKGRLGRTAVYQPEDRKAALSKSLEGKHEVKVPVITARKMPAPVRTELLPENEYAAEKPSAKPAGTGIFNTDPVAVASISKPKKPIAAPTAKAAEKGPQILDADELMAEFELRKQAQQAKQKESLRGTFNAYMPNRAASGQDVSTHNVRLSNTSSSYEQTLLERQAERIAHEKKKTSAVMATKSDK